jgi:hypothetical protein
MLLHLIRQELPLESNSIKSPLGAAKETRIAVAPQFIQESPESEHII